MRTGKLSTNMRQEINSVCFSSSICHCVNRANVTQTCMKLNCDEECVVVSCTEETSFLDLEWFSNPWFMIPKQFHRCGVERRPHVTRQWTLTRRPPYHMENFPFWILMVIKRCFDGQLSKKAKATWCHNLSLFAARHTKSFLPSTQVKVQTASVSSCHF